MFLPGTGRGTAGAAGGGGASPQASRLPHRPSTSLRLVPLPLQGRNTVA